MFCSRRTRVLSVAAFSLLAALSAFAAAPVDEPAAAVLRARMSQILPGTEIGAIRAVGDSGLFEVAYDGSNLAYIDAAGKYIFLGNIYRTDTRENLTKARKDELLHIDYAALPFDKSFKRVRGDGRRQLAIFTDPDCPYCKRLEAELDGIENVAIHVFLLPLTSIHADAERKAKRVWCAADRSAAWTGLMRDGKEPGGDADCATPIGDIALLARRLGISATPGIVFPSGKVVPGYIPRAQIEQLLAN